MARQVFRSPVAVAVWWVWVLFAAGNLIDIAVRGRDRFSLVTALVLVAVTGVMYAGAWRPRLIADDAGLTIVNPLRKFRIGWASVAAVDMAELIRVRCEWRDGPDGEHQRKVIYAWAAGSSRRGQALARLRTERRGRSRRDDPAGAAAMPGAAMPGGATPGGGPGDAEKIVAALTARADEARAAARAAARAVSAGEPAATGDAAAGPVSAWCWPAIAAAGVPLLALLTVLAA